MHLWEKWLWIIYTSNALLSLVISTVAFEPVMFYPNFYLHRMYPQQTTWPETSVWFATDVRSCRCRCTMAKAEIIVILELTAGSWYLVGSLKFHLLWGQNRASWGPENRTDRLNPSMNRCPPQGWRWVQTSCVGNHLQNPVGLWLDIPVFGISETYQVS